MLELKGTEIIEALQELEPRLTVGGHGSVVTITQERDGYDLEVTIEIKKVKSKPQPIIHDVSKYDPITKKMRD